MTTAATEVANGMTEMAASIESVTKDGEALATSVAEVAVGGRADGALDRRRSRQRRRSRRRSRADVELDQQHGGVDRASRARAPRTWRDSSRKSRRPSRRRRARWRAWRRTPRRSRESVESAATSATQLDRSIRGVALLVGEARELSQRVTRDAEEGGQAIDRSIEGLDARARVDGAVGRRREGSRQARRGHHVDRRHDQPHRRADEPALAERVDRSGARRRSGPRIRRRRRRDSQPRRPLGEGDGGHRRRSSRRCRASCRTRSTSSAEGQRVAEESGRLAADGAAGLKRILVEHRAERDEGRTDRARHRRAARRRARTSSRSSRRRRRRRSRSRPGTAEQARALQGLVRTTGQMRTVAQAGRRRR